MKFPNSGGLKIYQGGSGGPWRGEGSEAPWS